jgi:hypothetical protein
MASLVESTIRRAYWRLANVVKPRANSGYPADFTADEIATIEAVREQTLTTQERVVSLVRAVDYIVQQRVEGDIVECGVWKGGSMMAAALTLMRHGQTDRTLHLYDTFDGMPPPTAVDQDYLGNSAAGQMAVMDKDAVIWARAQLEEVRANLSQTGYPVGRTRYIKGKVEDTIPMEIPDRIALLRLDTDWYESTKHELKHLFPRLIRGGVLILDDYGHWQGARQAVDEYIAEQRLQLLLCRIDMGGRIAIKQ